MEGASEPKTPAPVKSKSATEGRWPASMKIVAVVFVVLLIIVSIVAYAVLMNKSSEGLKASVIPTSLTVNAGASDTLEATATFNGESIDGSPNASFRWSVSDSALGNFSATHSRTTTFEAAKAGGTGTITCNVSFVSEDGSLSVEVVVNLVVNAPTLASVAVSPPGTTLVYDRAVVFNVTAVDSVGDDIMDIPDADISWTVWGLPEANCTLNRTHGASVNVTANMTGTVLLNVTVAVDSVTRSSSVTVHVIVAAPTVTLSHQKLPAGAGINWTWTEPTSPLKWDEVTIQLTDGTDTVNWSLTMEGLDGGTYNMSQFAPRVLGALTVFLNITDVDGNGYMNSTDFFLFTTSGGKFNPISNYVMTLMYDPTGLDTVAETAFNG